MNNGIDDLLLHYDGLKIKRYIQLWEYAKALDYGTDVYMGGDEYCQTQNVNNRKEYYRVIFDAYNELKNHEKYIEEDYNLYMEKERVSFIPYRSEECKAVVAMFWICKSYHDEIEYIVEELNLCQKSEKSNIKKKERLEYISVKTEREKKYFAKAIEAGLMGKTDRGCRWLHNNGLKASLGYFLNRVFNPKGTTQIPYQRMENIFNVSRLDVAIDQAINTKRPQKWRKEIDVLFDD